MSFSPCVVLTETSAGNLQPNGNISKIKVFVKPIYKCKLQLILEYFYALLVGKRKC